MLPNAQRKPVSDFADGGADASIQFRRTMGLFATGVCVISVPAGEQGVTAMTVNSLVSVSLDPLLLCWSLQNEASQFATYMEADRFAVSILAENHAELALRYAARGDAMLNADDFVLGKGGLPVIDDALATLECDRWSDKLAGDHTLIFGEVTGLCAPEDVLQAPAPLGFFNGKFCRIDGSWT